MTLAEATKLAVPVDASQIQLKFSDVAEEAGIRYSWTPPEKPPFSPLTSVGNGAAFLDFDGDGWIDVLLVGAKPALFRNLQNGHFARVAVGLEDLPKFTYIGIGVGDYDRDGYPDVFLSGYRGGLLLHNEHGKRLRDVTREVGIDVHNGWTSAVAFADLDRDGWPDLVIGHFLDFDPQRRRMCQRHGLSFDCGPAAYDADKPQVYRNLGNGKFQDVTRDWGFDASSGKNLALSVADLDGDGQVEVVFTNDQAPGDLFVRHGDRWQNEGIASGTAFNRMGTIRAGMGVTVADFDLDGKLDMAMSDFAFQGASLFRGIGPLVYKDVSGERGVKSATFPWLGFGILFADLDNNGWPDLVVANGHVYDNSMEVFGTVFKEPLLLLYNQGGKFISLPGKLQGKAAQPLMGRGLCAADYDHDGRLDLLVVDSSGSARLLHNESQSGHYLSVRLRDRQGVAYGEGHGATLYAEIDGKERVFPCPAGGSYSSVSDPRVHLGLGAATQVSALTVQWPSGRRERFGPQKADQRIEIREGTGQEVKRP